MRRFDVVLLAEADDDIARNASWWAKNHSVRQAETWFYAVHEQLRELRYSPESYPLSRENDNFPFEIREMLVGLGSRRTFRAIFTVRGDVVYVLHVLRCSQDRLHPRTLELP